MAPLTYRPLALDNRRDLDRLAAWHNDPAIREHILRFCSEEDAGIHFDADGMQEYFRANVESPYKAIWMIDLEGEPVGMMTYELDPKKSAHQNPGTAWVAILLGESHARGRGLGTQAIAELERRARAAGARWAEAGIHAFNDASIKLFERLGYVEFHVRPSFVWHQGKMWDSRYLLKTL